MTQLNRVFPSGYPASDAAALQVQGKRDLLEVTGEMSLRPPSTHHRWLLAATAGLILVTGLVVHFAIKGPAGDFVADALYAVMLFVVLAFVFVRASGWRIGLVTFLLCAGIELFQLTGVPAGLAEVFPPSRLLLGTTFTAVDLVAYLVGALGATLVTSWRPLD
ncbi:ribosomal maturation YjgA family protein [Cryobacterium sp. AP23]